jgi:hypothetical protein
MKRMVSLEETEPSHMVVLPSRGDQHKAAHRWHRRVTDGLGAYVFVVFQIQLAFQAAHACQRLRAPGLCCARREQALVDATRRGPAFATTPRARTSVNTIGGPDSRAGAALP